MPDIAIEHWFSNNMEEQIVMADGHYILLELKTKKTVVIGNTIAEVKGKLKELGKDDQFPNFMHLTGSFLMEHIYKRMARKITKNTFMFDEPRRC